MKIFWLLFVSFFVFISPAFPQESLMAENNFNYFHAGIIAGATLMKKNIEATGSKHYEVSISANNNEIVSGGIIGAVFSWDFYKSQKVSHGLELRISYNFLQKTYDGSKMSFYNDGKVVTLTAENKFNMNFLEFNLLYHFLFANNHLGFTLGPGYYIMTGINYKETWPGSHPVTNETRLKTFSGYCGEYGLEYLYYYKNLVIVPNVKISTKGYIDEYDLDDGYRINSLLHYLIGVDIRYAF